MQLKDTYVFNHGKGTVKIQGARNNSHFMLPLLCLGSVVNRMPCVWSWVFILQKLAGAVCQGFLVSHP